MTQLDLIIDNICEAISDEFGLNAWCDEEGAEIHITTDYKDANNRLAVVIYLDDCDVYLNEFYYCREIERYIEEIFAEIFECEDEEEDEDEDEDEE